MKTFRPPAEVVVTEYLDALGNRRTVDPEIVARIEALVTHEADVIAGPRPTFAHPGDDFGAATVHLEDGGEVEVRGTLPPEVPLGYHTISDDGGSRRLIVSPGRCFLPAGWHTWGVAVQLYASRSRRSWGIGDLTDLAELGRWSRRHGADFVLVNPLRATAPVAPQEASPYSPTSRRFLNPLYLDVDAIASSVAGEHVVADLRAAGRALDDVRRIDRDAVHRLKMDALARLFDHAPRRCVRRLVRRRRRGAAVCRLECPRRTSWRGLAAVAGPSATT